VLINILLVFSVVKGKSSNYFVKMWKRSDRMVSIVLRRIAAASGLFLRL